MEAINTELLINLVEERPVIWDKTLDSYKDKKLKESAWREICVILNESFEDLEQKQRQDFGKLVLKKWTQMRDSWMKCLKKQKGQKKSGSSAKPSRLYVFHEQMSFLKKIITDTTGAHESTETNTNEESTEENIITGQNPEICEQSAVKPGSSGMQRKRKSDMKNELDAKMVKFIDHQINLPKADHDNRHMSFFKSLLPSLSSFNDDQTLEFQAGVIAVLQNIKRNQQRSFYNFSSQPPRQMNYCEWQNSGSFTQPQINTAASVPMMSPASVPMMSPASVPMMSPASVPMVSPASSVLSPEFTLSSDSNHCVTDLDLSSF